MASPLGNIGDLGGLGNLNLNNLNLNNYGNKIGMNGLNQDIINYKNITKLDDFLTSQNSAGGPNVSEQLQGVITKIQDGQKVQESDFANLSDQDREIAQDLKVLLDKNNGASPLESSHGSEKVVDSFSDLLGKYINNVDQKHKVAEKAVETFATGGNIDLHTVMIAAEKANLSMQLTVQLRNKILQAYQTINRIRV